MKALNHTRQLLGCSRLRACLDCVHTACCCCASAYHLQLPQANVWLVGKTGKRGTQSAFYDMRNRTTTLLDSSGKSLTFPLGQRSLVDVVPCRMTSRDRLYHCSAVFDSYKARLVGAQWQKYHGALFLRPFDPTTGLYGDGFIAPGLLFLSFIDDNRKQGADSGMFT